jgi:hypothetical protein
MKNLKILLLFMLLTTGTILGDVGCMDTSKHTKIKDGYDYKTLHPVECSCPCRKQRHLLRKGKCFKCGHYIKHDTQAYDMSFLYDTPSDSIFGKVMPYKYF